MKNGLSETLYSGIILFIVYNLTYYLHDIFRMLYNQVLLCHINIYDAQIAQQWLMDMNGDFFMNNYNVKIVASETNQVLGSCSGYLYKGFIPIYFQYTKHVYREYNRQYIQSWSSSDIQDMPILTLTTLKLFKSQIMCTLNNIQLKHIYADKISNFKITSNEVFLISEYNINHISNINIPILKAGIWENLYHSIQTFFQDKQKYIQFNLPYRYVILLYGPPGTGKSSILYRLGFALKRNIYHVESLTVSNMIETKTNSIFIFNDIEHLMPILCKKNENVMPPNQNNTNMPPKLNQNDSVNYAQLLSFLDTKTLSGNIIIMTTNCELDEFQDSFTRDARFNKKIKIDYADDDQAYDIYKYYCPHWTDDEIYARMKKQKQTHDNHLIPASITNECIVI